MAGYAAGGEWCAPVTETLADGSTIEYRVSSEVPVPNTNPRAGRAQDRRHGHVPRRAAPRLHGARARPAASSGFGDLRHLGQERHHCSRTSRSSATATNVNVRTNGNIMMKNHAYVCGDVTPGPGRTLTQEPRTTSARASRRLRRRACCSSTTTRRAQRRVGHERQLAARLRRRPDQGRLHGPRQRQVGREQARADRREQRDADAQRQRLLALPAQPEEQLAAVHRAAAAGHADQVLLRLALEVRRADREHHDRERLGDHEQQHGPDDAPVLRPRLDVYRRRR